MNPFLAYLIKQRPLYADTSLHITVQDAVKFHEDFLIEQGKEEKKSIEMRNAEYLKEGNKK